MAAAQPVAIVCVGMAGESAGLCARLSPTDGV